MVDDAVLTLRFLGGRTPDGATLTVAGMPRFAVGDRAAVFSAGNGLEPCPLVGWWQGLYRLLFDAGQEVFTIADHAGRPVVAINGDADPTGARLSLRSNDDETANPLTLEQFRNAIGAVAR